MSFKKVQTFAPQPSTTRGQAVHLGGDPKGVNFLYTNGRSVIIRNLENPEIATEYTGHSCAASVARYSPSGFYIASGGKHKVTILKFDAYYIRIWDTTQAENILKTETRAFAGRINDLEWDFESKKIVAVGEGKDRFGHAFSFDTLSSIGEISGHSKVINSVSLRQQRPYRVVTGSDDQTVNFYHGVPFKFNKSINDHSRFVQCVRFSPNGDHFVTAGMDKKIFLYDGKTGDKVSELTVAENTHRGGIFSVCWSPDGKFLSSHSADTTVKIWDVSAAKVVSTYNFSDSLGQINDQQVGGLWQGKHLLSLSLDGSFNYLDTKSSGKPWRVVKGHQKAITALAVADGTLYTGSYDGSIYAWNQGSTSSDIGGTGHSNQVTSLAVDGDTVYTTGMDDSLRSFNRGTKTFGPNVLATESIPKSVASKNNIGIVTTINKEIIVINNSSKVSSLKVNYTPTVAAINGSEVAIGGEDGKVYIYLLANNNLNPVLPPLEKNKGPISALSYSPDGSLLASGDGQKTIVVFDVATKEVKIHQWVFHNAKVNSIAWSPDGEHAASGSLDTNVEIWSVAKPMKHLAIKGAHLESSNCVAWLGNNTLASGGQDGSVKIWEVTHV